VTIRLTPEQRERVLAELALRTKPAAQMTDEELLQLLQRGEFLVRKLDPEYGAKFQSKGASKNQRTHK